MHITSPYRQIYLHKTTLGINLEALLIHIVTIIGSIKQKVCYQTPPNSNPKAKNSQVANNSLLIKVVIKYTTPRNSTSSLHFHPRIWGASNHAWGQDTNHSLHIIFTTYIYMLVWIEARSVHIFMGVKTSTLRRAVSFAGSGSRRRLLGPPRGYIPVAVGVDEETKRFMVHTKALSNAEFLQFLRRSEEEYGFCNQGILRIQYDAKAFEEWLRTSSKHRDFRIQPTIT